MLLLLHYFQPSKNQWLDNERLREWRDSSLPHLRSWRRHRNEIRVSCFDWVPGKHAWKMVQLTGYAPVNTIMPSTVILVLKKECPVSLNWDWASVYHQERTAHSSVFPWLFSFFPFFQDGRLIYVQYLIAYFHFSFFPMNDNQPSERLQTGEFNDKRWQEHHRQAQKTRRCFSRRHRKKK